MSLLGQLHLASACIAIATGAAVLVIRPKGTRWHRWLGWLYAGSMLALNVTALLIYRLFGGFGPFHAAAIVSLIGVVAGVHAARRARSSRTAREMAARSVWVERHYQWMTWSYVGLIAAFASEAITRLPAFRPVFGAGRAFGIAVGVATLVIVAIGSAWIRRARAGALASFRSAAPRG